MVLSDDDWNLRNLLFEPTSQRKLIYYAMQLLDCDCESEMLTIYENKDRSEYTSRPKMRIQKRIPFVAFLESENMSEGIAMEMYAEHLKPLFEYLLNECNSEISLCYCVILIMVSMPEILEQIMKMTEQNVSRVFFQDFVKWVHTMLYGSVGRISAKKIKTEQVAELPINIVAEVKIFYREIIDSGAVCQLPC
jgi:hypothetical protein